MFIDSSVTRLNGKTYTRYLLRDSYREDGKVKHRTLMNLSRCRPEEIAAIELALKHKGDSPARILRPRRDRAVAARAVLRRGVDVVGSGARTGWWRRWARTAGRLALWQVLARAIDQGSRLSAVRLASVHAACDVLDLDRFDEDDLYANLDWLAVHQAEIERRLFAQREAAAAPVVFLYDVTSSYLEGTRNELAAFGYNRDNKRGKRQIVIGLLTDADGRPLSVEVFPGNTADPDVPWQVRKVAERFGGGEVTFVGDRGMIKSSQVEDRGRRLSLHHGDHEAADRRAHRPGVLQLGLFDATLAEVTPDGARYVLRRNPARAEELAASRADKLEALQAAAETANAYLSEHQKAAAKTQIARLKARSETLGLDKFVAVAGRGAARRRHGGRGGPGGGRASRRLLRAAHRSAEDRRRQDIVHDRYKDLARVEWAFRDSKTVQLEMRPVYLRDEDRTRGHALVVMLAYLLVQALRRRWRDIDLTVQEALDRLASLCLIEVSVGGRPSYNQVPTPRDDVRRLFEAADVAIPTALPLAPARVATRQKLPQRRKAK